MNNPERECARSCAIDQSAQSGSSSSTSTRTLVSTSSTGQARSGLRNKAINSSVRHFTCAMPRTPSKRSAPGAAVLRARTSDERPCAAPGALATTLSASCNTASRTNTETGTPRRRAARSMRVLSFGLRRRSSRALAFMAAPLYGMLPYKGAALKPRAGSRVRREQLGIADLHRFADRQGLHARLLGLLVVLDDGLTQRSVEVVEQRLQVCFALRDVLPLPRVGRLRRTHPRHVAVQAEEAHAPRCDGMDVVFRHLVLDVRRVEVLREVGEFLLQCHGARVYAGFRASGGGVRRRGQRLV